MREVFRSNQMIQLSYVESQLMDHGISPINLDQHTSVVDGSIGAIQRRIMVEDNDYDAAMRIMNEIKDTL